MINQDLSLLNKDCRSWPDFSSAWDLSLLNKISLWGGISHIYISQGEISDYMTFDWFFSILQCCQCRRSFNKVCSCFIVKWCFCVFLPFPVELERERARLQAWRNQLQRKERQLKNKKSGITKKRERPGAPSKFTMSQVTFSCACDILKKINNIFLLD